MRAYTLPKTLAYTLSIPPSRSHARPPTCYRASVNVVAITNVKGGSGKTSTAVPLAWLAAQHGRTVLLDLDPSGSATQWHTTAGLSDHFECRRLSHDQLGACIDELRGTGDTRWVIIDTPAVREEMITPAMGEADLVVFPVHTGTGDLGQLAQTAKLLRLPLRANPNLRYTVVINHTGRAPGVDRDTRAAIEEFGMPVAKTEIPDLKIYSTAKGVRPNVKMWHYESLWRELQQVLA